MAAQPQIPPEQLAILQKEDLGPLTVTVVSVFTALAFISVCLRFFTRVTITRSVGLEDYSIALAMCFSICMAGCQVMQVKWGSGKHMMFITSLEAVTSMLRYLYFSILAYCTCLTLTKLSILLQYRRIFTLKEMRLPIYIAMGICMACGIEAVLTGTFSCIPVDAFWEVMKKPTAKCVNENALYYANAGLNVATDLLVAALPVKAIWDLQMPRKQKIALLMILTIGWFVCIVSILRLHALVVLAQHPEDTTWYGTATAYWSAIECNLAIVCASTPALKPLIIKVVPSFSSRFGSNQSKSKESNDTKDSRDRKSFIELKAKGSERTMSEDLERGDGSAPVTALPSVANERPARGNIHYTREIEQYSVPISRNSDGGSQQDLVHPKNTF